VYVFGADGYDYGWLVLTPRRNESLTLDVWRRARRRRRRTVDDDGRPAEDVSSFSQAGRLNRGKKKSCLMHTCMDGRILAIRSGPGKRRVRVDTVHNRVIHQVVVMSAADARPLGELAFKQLLPIS